MTMTRAMVREVDGQLVLDDPDAVAVARAVEKHNCRLTLDAQAERIAYFKGRAELRGVDEVVIVVLNVDDPNGRQLTEILMPGQEVRWQEMRDAGQVPFARGLATRDGVQELVDTLDAETGRKLRGMAGKAAVVVMDRGVVEAFEA
jgi:hypothetical protein